MEFRCKDPKMVIGNQTCRGIVFLGVERQLTPVSVVLQLC